MSQSLSDLAKPTSPGTRFRHWWTASLVIVAIAAFPLKWLLDEWDHALGNLAWIGLITVFLISGIAWMWTHPSVSVPVRWGMVCLATLSFFIASWNYEFEGFSGEMIPNFRKRISVSREIPLHSPLMIEPEKEAQVSFRQFMGDERNGQISGTKLQNWSDTSPQIVWRQSVGAGWAGIAIRGTRAVTLEQVKDQEQVVCFDMATGKRLWEFAYAARHFHLLGGLGPRSTPTIEGDRVLTQGATGIVTCLSLTSGKVHWQMDLLEHSGISVSDSELAITWGRSGSPLVHQSMVLLPLGGSGLKIHGSLIALDIENGKPLWVGGSDQISYASPVLAELCGMLQVVLVTENFVGGYDLQRGKELWKYEWPGGSNSDATASQPILVDANRLLVSKGYAVGSMLLELSLVHSDALPQPTGNETRNAIEAKIVWKETSIFKTKFSNPVRVGEFAYGLSDGILECIQISNGKRQWKRGRYGHGQILSVGDHLLVSSEEGQLILVAADPNAHYELGRFSVLDGKTWNPFAMAGRYLLMRNASEIACVQIPVME